MIFVAPNANLLARRREGASDAKGRLRVISARSRRHMAVKDRKFVLTLWALDELVDAGSPTDQAARFLEAPVAAGLNILVAGGAQPRANHDAGLVGG
jgi:Flp pilus assembly CpaF family ATPase